MVSRIAQVREPALNAYYRSEADINPHNPGRWFEPGLPETRTISCRHTFDDLCKNEVEMLGGVKTIGATGEVSLLLLRGIDVFHDAKAKLGKLDGQPAWIES